MGMITSCQMLLPLFSQLDFPQEGSGEAIETPELAIWWEMIVLDVANMGLMVY